MARQKKAGPEPLKFEEALQKLELIVEELERGDVPLDTALLRYREGMELAAVCTKRLQEAETVLADAIVSQQDGVVTATPWEPIQEEPK